MLQNIILGRCLKTHSFPSPWQCASFNAYTFLTFVVFWYNVFGPAKTVMVDWALKASFRSIPSSWTPHLVSGQLFLCGPWLLRMASFGPVSSAGCRHQPVSAVPGQWRVELACGCCPAAPLRVSGRGGVSGSPLLVWGPYRLDTEQSAKTHSPSQPLNHPFFFFFLLACTCCC